MFNIALLRITVSKSTAMCPWILLNTTNDSRGPNSFFSLWLIAMQNVLAKLQSWILSFKSDSAYKIQRPSWKCEVCVARSSTLAEELTKAKQTTVWRALPDHCQFSSATSSRSTLRPSLRSETMEILQGLLRTTFYHSNQWSAIAIF